VFQIYLKHHNCKDINLITKRSIFVLLWLRSDDMCQVSTGITSGQGDSGQCLVFDPMDQA